MTNEEIVAARWKCVNRAPFFTTLSRAEEGMYLINCNPEHTVRVQIAHVRYKHQALGFMVVGMHDRTVIARALGEDYTIQFHSN